MIRCFEDRRASISSVCFGHSSVSLDVRGSNRLNVRFSPAASFSERSRPGRPLLKEKLVLLPTSHTFRWDTNVVEILWK